MKSSKQAIKDIRISHIRWMKSEISKLENDSHTQFEMSDSVRREFLQHLSAAWLVLDREVVALQSKK